MTETDSVMSREKQTSRTSAQYPLAILLDEHVEPFPWILPDQPTGENKNGAPRGNVIASQAIIEAFVKTGIVPLSFCTYSNMRQYVESAAVRIEESLNKHTKFSTVSLDDLNRSGDRLPGVFAWLNPLPYCNLNGGVEVAQLLRRTLSRNVFPITTLFHGFGSRALVYNFFLRYFVGDCLPCDSIVCTSDSSASAVRALIGAVEEKTYEIFAVHKTYVGRIDVIPLCVDTSLFQPQSPMTGRARLAIDPGDFVILYLGRLSPLKADLYPFLDVHKALCQNNPGRRIHLILAGTQDRGYGATLLQAAHERDTGEVVRIVPYVSGREKAELIAAADVLFCPSDTSDETFGLSPVEAMACGVPQVVSDWDGFKSTVVHGGTGFRVPTYWGDCTDDLVSSEVTNGAAFDRLAMSQALIVDLGRAYEYLQALIDSDCLRREMGSASRARAVAEFSFTAVVKRYLALFEDLASQSSKIPSDFLRGGYEENDYQRLFRSYPSQIISSSAEVKMTPVGIAIANNLKPWPRIVSRQVISQILATKILSVVCSCFQESDVVIQPTCSLENVVEKTILLSPSSKRPEIVRHVMWLAKYGLVTLKG